MRYLFAYFFFRVEKQNADYREQLLRTLRERDLNEELVKNVRGELAGKMDELERKCLEYEYQLKAAKVEFPFLLPKLLQDRSAAQELHYNANMKEMTNKMNLTIGQLSKKLEAADKEKTDAVIRYATREAEGKRLQAEAAKAAEELKASKAEIEALKASVSHQELEQLVRVFSL